MECYGSTALFVSMVLMVSPKLISRLMIQISCFKQVFEYIQTRVYAFNVIGVFKKDKFGKKVKTRFHKILNKMNFINIVASV